MNEDWPEVFSHKSTLWAIFLSNYTKMKIWLWSGVGVVGFILALMFGMPNYNVWQQGLEGQAEYSKAEQNRRIKILEAEARLESAKLEALAEVEKAKGLAQANAIVAEGLEGHDEYLRYLYITHLEEGSNREVIYIPTEAGLPILEAGKR